VRTRVINQTKIWASLITYFFQNFLFFTILLLYISINNIQMLNGIIL